MWSYNLGAGSGKKNKNIHFFEIPEHILNSGEYFRIIFGVKSHAKDFLSCKLKKDDGSQHDLPYFFTKGELSHFFIVVDGVTTDYSFEYTMHVWPKELPDPISKYFSISTVDIQFEPSNKSIKTPPSLRYRKKGEEKWITADDTKITFDRSIDDIYEAQLFYELPNDTIITSNIIDVKCMWNHFDLDSKAQINLDYLSSKQLFELTVDANSLYNNTCTATMRMIEPIDHNAASKVVEIMFSDVSQTKGMHGKNKKPIELVPGARYELKLNASRPDISYSRIIEVPCYAPVDQKLWTSLFEGDPKTVNFGAKSFIKPILSPNDRRYEEEHTFKLHKHGLFSFHTYGTDSTPRFKHFAGAFKLVQIDATTLHIELTKSFRNLPSFKPPTPIVSAADPTNQEQAPMALQLPELLHTIAKYVDYNHALINRLVCKQWFSIFKPIIVGQLTSKSAQLLGKILNRRMPQIEPK